MPKLAAWFFIGLMAVLLVTVVGWLTGLLETLISKMRQSMRVGVQRTPAPEFPIDQSNLLDAFELFLQGAVGLAAEAGRKPRRSPGPFIIFAIFVRLVQLARSIQAMARSGYANEAQPHARAMVNAAVNLIFIAEADSDARGLLFAFFSQKRRARRAESLVKQGFLNRKAAEVLEAAEIKKDEEALKHQEESGVKPAAKLGSANTWTGLSDQDLMKRVGRSDWYDIYYVPFSDAVHANIVGVQQEIIQLSRGEVSYGPRYPGRVLLLVVMGAADALSEALLNLSKYFSLNKEKEVEGLKAGIHAALKTYAAGRSFQQNV